DWHALPYVARGWSADAAAGRLPGAVEGLRIAFSPRLAYVKWVDPEIERTVAEAARRFEELGAVVEEVDPGFEDCTDVFRVHWFSSARHALHRLPDDKLRLLDPGLRQAIEHAARY